MSDFSTWSEISPQLNILLLDSSTKKRISILKNILQMAQDGDKLLLEEVPGVSLNLLKTYQWYQDSKSRDLVLAILLQFVRVNPDLLPLAITKFIYKIASSQKVIALTSLLTLFEWTNGFVQRQANAQLVECQLLLLDKILNLSVADAATGHDTSKEQHKRRIRLSSETQLVTSVQTLAEDLQNLDLYINSVLESSALSLSAKLAVFGLVGTLSYESLPQNPQFFDKLAASGSVLKSKVVELVNKHLVTLKTVQPYSLQLFTTGFISHFYNLPDLELLVQVLEKCGLRNSELTFGQITPALFVHLESNSDLIAVIVRNKMLSQLISNYKASKETTRAGASSSLRAVIRRFAALAQELDLAKIIDELFKSLKTVSLAAVDQKLLFTKTLAEFAAVESGVISAKVCDGIWPSVAKDQNEVSLFNGLELLFAHLLVQHFPLELLQKYKELIVQAINAEKKPNLRKCWLASVGEFVARGAGADFVATVLPVFQLATEDIVANPLLSVANKSIEAAYVTLAIAPNDHNLAEKVLLDSEKKPSVVNNPRVYTKLTTELEKKWFQNALFAESTIRALDSGLPLLFVTLSKKMSPALRRAALDKLGQSLARASGQQLGEQLVDLITNALYAYLASSDPVLDFVDELDLKSVPGLVNVLTQSSPDVAFRKHAVARLISVCHSANVVIKGSWVGVLQRLKVDPGAVVAEQGAALVDQLLGNLLLLSKDAGCIYDATLQLLATLLFIDSALVAPLLADSIRSDVQKSRLHQVNPLNLQIWSLADADHPVVDVLNAKKSSTTDKNSKDYETRLWEEKVRADLAKKKAAPKKLTKEEQLLVGEQLLKEAQIRADLDAERRHLVRGLSLVDCLTSHAKDIDNGQSVWFPVAVAGILEVLQLCQQAQAHEFLRLFPVEVFLHLSQVLSPRLGATIGQFLGVATLRVLGIELQDESLTQEPVLELVSRVLFRVKFLSVQRPLDLLSLVYILPLLTQLLHKGEKLAIKNARKPVQKSEFVEEDPEEEHLLLLVEIISTHAELFQDESIPRHDILAVLLRLLQLPLKLKLAKECFLVMCQNIAVNISDADLQLVLSACLKPETFVRTTVLELLDAEFELSSAMQYSNEIWIAIHDTDPANAQLAATIWSENEFQLPEDAPGQLLAYLGALDSGIRLSVAQLLALAIAHLSPDDVGTALDQLLLLYCEKLRPPPPVLDLFGLPNKSADQKDAWEERSGVALTLKFLAPLFKSESSVRKLFEFLARGSSDSGNTSNDIVIGLAETEASVRQELQEAGVQVIDANGYRFAESLIPVFEDVLAAKDSGTKVQDQIKENVIILYGSLARHLDAADARLQRVVSKLILTLATPSEDVQVAVSECLAPLMSLFDESQVAAYLEELISTLFDLHKSLAARRGALYGVAGVVKGCGIVLLARYDIVRHLVDAAEDKKDAKRRESVSFAIECLSQSLGALFEPYVIEVLPLILKQLGDSSAEVRELTDYATRAIMKHTTSFGVKQLIPLLIQNLDDILWRTKRGSVDLLGAMAYLDPTQLSASLSQIVPEIVAVLNDSHKEVRKSADLALKRFGEVIRNPEIQTLVPVLIKAIGDPTKHTDELLDALIQTQFVHYIDGPSLALIIHVIHRGMHDRSASTRRKACQIVGNMSILVDSKDLVTYLPELVAELESSMVDPVPLTRATASRALGSLVEKLGEDQFPDLIPRLLDTLQDEAKEGDRLGSAQGLSEIISALGTAKLEEMLPTILQQLSNSRSSYIRAGFMPLLLFLPVCFGMQFSPYLDRVIPVILEGLALEEEVRETALKAARLIVKNYATKAVDLLLPELERGLSDFSYRIRLSSVELTGELLFQVSGISGKLELDEQQLNVGHTLVQVLGQDTRDSILANLFVCRQDTSGLVRNATVDIWKLLVANTPKTVKEILPTLTTIIIRRLASPDDQLRAIAAQTLGELVRRVGANALDSLLPTLEHQLVASDSDAKQGICIAVRELVESSSAEAVLEHELQFVAIVRDALVDANEPVREAAASLFDVLQDVLGHRAIDQIIPQLLVQLGSSGDESGNALLALQDIMSTKSEVIFPILIPSLLAAPIDAAKAQALASLAEVAGSALYKRLSVIVNALVDRLCSQEGSPEELQQILHALDAILVSVNSEDGVHPLLQQLVSLIKHEDHTKRAVILARLAPFFENTVLDYSVYTQDIATYCIMTLDDPDPSVVQSLFVSLTLLVKKQSKDSLEKLVKPAKQLLEITGTAGSDLAAFALPRGPNCILPIFLHGLMYGTSEQREVSALGIADVVEKTPAANLKPFVTVIVGPLIRVIGERFSGDVKAAILYALNVLFSKIPALLRPFIPQLQRTFVKSLSDPTNELLRSRAAKLLGSLIEFQSRVDPLVNELVGGCKLAADTGVRTAMLKLLLEVVDKAGAKMSEGSKNSVMELVELEMGNADDKMAVAYARLVGSLAKILSHLELAKMLKSKVLDASLDDANGSKFAVLTLNAFLRDSPAHIFETGMADDIIAFTMQCCNCSHAYLSDNGIIAAVKVMLLQGERRSPFSEESEQVFNISADSVQSLVHTLAVCMTKPASGSLDTRRLALVGLRTVARFKFDELVKPNIGLVAPSVFACVRDIIIPIKLAAEKLFLAIFQLVEDEKMTFFNEWFAGLTGPTVTTVSGQTLQTRSIGDYSKRVAARLANVERERIAAGGDKEAMFSDRYEDESEIWAVGGVDLSEE